MDKMKDNTMTEYGWSIYVFQSVNGKRTLRKYPFVSWGEIDVDKLQEGWDYFDYLMGVIDPGAVALVMIPFESDVMNRQYNITDKDIMEFAVLRANEAFKVLRKNIKAIDEVLGEEENEDENEEKNKEDEEIDKVNKGYITFRQWYESQKKMKVDISGLAIAKFWEYKDSYPSLFSTDWKYISELVKLFGDYKIIGVSSDKIYCDNGKTDCVLKIDLLWD